MKKLLIASTLLLASISQADVIKCVFTEPFIDTTYSMVQQTLTVRTAGDEKAPVVIKNVSFQIKGPALFQLIAKDGSILQTLTLNNKGSNGMSDTIYPYDVKYGNTKQHALYGGCTSNYLKSKEPAQ